MRSKVFCGAEILTLDSGTPTVEALRVEGEKITAVGSLAEVDAASADETIDLGGGCLIPSLKDHHLHLTAVGLALLNAQEDERVNLNLAGAASADEIVERVRERASQVEPGLWILGMGWNQHDWVTPELPSHEALSVAVPDHPVFLVRIDAHSAWVNQAAMRIAEIPEMDTDPYGGEIHRNADRTPSGMLLERAVEPVLDEIPGPAGWEVRAAFGHAADALAARGVTEVFDAGFMASPAMVSMMVDFELYLELLAWSDAESPLAVDVNLMIPSPSPLADKIVADPDAYRELSPRHRVTHIKLFADGAFGSRGAALSHPYVDDPSTRGFMRMSDAELQYETRRAIDSGLDISTHAIGDDAVHRVLNAYSAVADGTGADPRRFRIEHFAYASAKDIRRAAAAGFVLVAQPQFIDPDANGKAMEDWRLGEENGDRVYPWKTLHDLGANLAMSSDYYIAPGPALLDFYVAFSRCNREGLPNNGWQPQERLSRLDSLRLATALRAAGGGDQRGGVLRAGEPADLALLSSNPLTVDSSEVLGIDVTATFRRGEPTFPDSG